MDTSIVDIIAIIIATLSLVTAIVSCCFAFLSLIIGICTLCVTRTIAKQQRRKEEAKFLSNALIYPYNIIESDIMSLATGKDYHLDHDKFDQEVLNNICTAKSYALFYDNKKLFNYLDGLITGKTKEQMGLLIEDYFTERDILSKKCGGIIDEANGKILRGHHLEKTRELRNRTLKQILVLTK